MLVQMTKSFKENSFNDQSALLEPLYWSLGWMPRICYFKTKIFKCYLPVLLLGVLAVSCELIPATVQQSMLWSIFFVGMLQHTFETWT